MSIADVNESPIHPYGVLALVIIENYNLLVAKIYDLISIKVIINMPSLNLRKTRVYDISSYYLLLYTVKWDTGSSGGGQPSI